MQYKHKRANSQAEAVSVLAKLCLLLFLSSFFAGQTASGFFSKQQAGDNQTAGAVFSDYSVDLSHAPFHLPFAPEPNSADENGYKEGADDQLNEWHCTAGSSEYFKSGNAKSSALSFHLCFQKRPAVSLFILLCSWKSFLI